MANSKISALTSATTPLAGTEVLPIVQSSTTKQVSVANLTAGRTQTSNGIVQGTAATGYNFTANTPAAGMTSQLLNWYEQGTSTATLTCGTSGTITLNAGQNTLSYTRVGRVVTVTGYISVSSVSAPLGRLTLNGLPFTCANGLQYQAAMTVYAASLTATAITAIQGRVTNNSTTATIDNFSTGDSTFDLANKVQAGSNFAFSFSYFAA
jgi:hypothetical protein